jgi:predicted DCC family thiol-disulfide oxidoreductase YuxK
MKTLKDHIIFYDAACPMCGAYTSGFVKAGMLDENGREAYQSLSALQSDNIDRERAVNEIALLNTRTGAVSYGIDSLFKVLGHSFPVLRPLLRLKPFGWLMDKLYKFISFNRRVIMPATGRDCEMPAPARRRVYRIAWLVVTWFITASILAAYSHHLKGVIPASGFYREFLICGGQIFWQMAVLRLARKGSILDYLGNMMTISFAGGLLLLICSGLLQVSGVGEPLVFTMVFLLVAGGMLLEHGRRMRILGLGWIPTAGWVLYRLVVLAIILKIS